MTGSAEQLALELAKEISQASPFRNLHILLSSDTPSACSTAVCGDLILKMRSSCMCFASIYGFSSIWQACTILCQSWHQQDSYQHAVSTSIRGLCFFEQKKQVLLLPWKSPNFLSYLIAGSSSVIAQRQGSHQPRPRLRPAKWRESGGKAVCTGTYFLSAG